MSIKTWKLVYYPETAKQASKDPLKALDHSILKWSGLSKKVLKEHGIEARGTILLSIDTGFEVFFDVDGDTCALCEYASASDVYSPNPCVRCPIVMHTGNNCSTEYTKFRRDGETRPMLALLKKTRKSHLAAERRVATA